VNPAFTLKPIHYSMQYHLSFDNLNCIRRQLGSKNERTFIPELSIAGGACSDEDTLYQWSSEIYLDNGTFLQKQNIRTAFYKDGEYSPEHYIGCPHQSLSVYTPEFWDNDGLLEVEAWVMSKPSRCASHSMQKWSNSQGPYTHITSCTICHSDTESYIQLNGCYLDVKYTCFRDLGTGMDPSDSKWLSLLTGEGITHRPEYEFDVLTHVWYTASGLGRSNLDEVTHQTPKGVFHVRSRGG
ncbi:uncharacterized protein TRIVIDRAFT_52268, partial [Trichoderma virens Gv29-8]